MNDKLKEIREKARTIIDTEDIGLRMYRSIEVEQIQSETYQLGRQEVIDEITRHVTNKTFARKGELLIFPSDIYDKLNNLEK